jgi:DNA helicase TIP49 (TBP-interacting protein)
MCDVCANHVEPDTDFCDFHNSEIARAESTKAEVLHRERLRKMGMEDDL